MRILNISFHFNYPATRSVPSRRNLLPAALCTRAIFPFRCDCPVALCLSPFSRIWRGKRAPSSFYRAFFLFLSHTTKRSLFRTTLSPSNLRAIPFTRTYIRFGLLLTWPPPPSRALFPPSLPFLPFDSSCTTVPISPSHPSILHRRLPRFFLLLPPFSSFPPRVASAFPDLLRFYLAHSSSRCISGAPPVLLCALPRTHSALLDRRSCTSAF